MGKQSKPGLLERLNPTKKLMWFDRFPETIQLNFAKQSSIPTLPGVIVSLILLTATIIYGVQKFNKLYYRLQPMITEENRQGFYSAKDEIDLNEAGFKIAFGVLNYDTNARLDDPDFVRFQVFMEERKNLAIV